MFTGIVEELGEIVAVDPQGDSVALAVRGPLVTQDAVHGASIAVNGVCLTVVAVKDGVFTADVIKETLDKSSLGVLGPGSAAISCKATSTASARSSPASRGSGGTW
jgi:riboflavin synthase